jgi:hypothetical protein
MSQHNSFQVKLKIFRSELYNGTYEYFSNQQKHKSDLETHKTPDIQIFQIQMSKVTDSNLENFLHKMYKFTQ